jgi:hypothetical protein
MFEQRGGIGCYEGIKTNSIVNYPLDGYEYSKA